METKNRTIGKELTTSNSTVYTVPLYFESKIDSILITNATSNVTQVSLDWYDSLTNTYYTMTELMPLPPNGIVQITDPLMLKQNDLIRGLASANSAVTISVRVEEKYAPTRI